MWGQEPTETMDDHRRRGVTTDSGLGSPTLTINQENAPQTGL